VEALKEGEEVVPHDLKGEGPIGAVAVGDDGVAVGEEGRRGGEAEFFTEVGNGGGVEPFGRPATGPGGEEELAEVIAAGAGSGGNDERLPDARHGR